MRRPKLTAAQKAAINHKKAKAASAAIDRFCRSVAKLDELASRLPQPKPVAPSYVLIAVEGEHTLSVGRVANRLAAECQFIDSVAFSAAYVPSTHETRLVATWRADSPLDAGSLAMLSARAESLLESYNACGMFPA